MGCIVAPAVPAPADARLTITLACENALGVGDLVTHTLPIDQPSCPATSDSLSHANRIRGDGATLNVAL